MTKRRLLVLCIDVDDDLGQKARLGGPVVGRKANLEAASRLSLADPEDSDGNTMYQAVKTRDELASEGQADVEVATLTGDRRLGYFADRAIVKQLEKVLSDFRPDGCVFVSDGASDEQVLPVIQSRVKIDHVRNVTIKQAKELEKTYFAVLDKLKDPAFARILFGVPGAFLLAFAFSEYLGLRVLFALLGLYLVLKGVGLEEWLVRRAVNVGISPERLGFVAYFAAVPLIVISLALAANRVLVLQAAGVADPAKLGAWFVKEALLLVPLALLVVLGARMLESVQERRVYMLPNQGIGVVLVLLFWAVVGSLVDWVIGEVGFGHFFNVLVLGTLGTALTIYLMQEFRRSLIVKLRLDGKEVFTEVGQFIGRVVGVASKSEKILVKNASGQTFDLTFDHVASVGERVIVRY